MNSVAARHPDLLTAQEAAAYLGVLIAFVVIAEIVGAISTYMSVRNKRRGGPKNAK
jgi:hypothetical protein